MVYLSCRAFRMGARPFGLNRNPGWMPDRSPMRRRSANDRLIDPHPGLDRSLWNGAYAAGRVRAGGRGRAVAKVSWRTTRDDSETPGPVPDLAVRDLDRSLAFWSGMVSFRAPCDPPGKRFAMLAHGTAAAMLGETAGRRVARRGSATIRLTLDRWRAARAGGVPRKPRPCPRVVPIRTPPQFGRTRCTTWPAPAAAECVNDARVQCWVSLTATVGRAWRARVASCDTGGEGGPGRGLRPRRVRVVGAQPHVVEPITAAPRRWQR